ncbi:hypothetical protein AKO1_005764 [Acrasis kona]|uniref:Uncharacterized protein n=1 Tax=Acrasis kona TaxID=1008807 RepID=A0AAW2YMN7_9EUKA
MISARRELINKRTAQLDLLAEKFSLMFNFDADGNQLVVTNKNEIDVVWKLLEKSELLEQSLAQLSSQLYDVILEPFIKSTSSTLNVTESQNSASVIVKKKSSKTEDQKVDIGERINILQEFLLDKFQHIFHQPSSSVSKYLNNRITESVCQHLLAPQYHQLQPAVIQEFETNLNGQGWNFDFSKQDIQSLWVTYKFQSTILWIRSIMKDTFTFSEQVVKLDQPKDEAVLYFPSCTVPKVSVDLSTRVLELLQYNNQQLQPLIVNILDFIRYAGAKYYHNHQVPRVAALYYNHCMFMSFKFMEMVDQSELYKNAANTHQEQEVASQISQLTSLFSQNSNNPLTAVPEVINNLKRITHAYTDILPIHAMRTLCAHIASGICDYILEQIIFGGDQDMSINREKLSEFCNLHTLDENWKHIFAKNTIYRIENWEKLVTVKNILQTKDPVVAAKKYRKSALTDDEMKTLIQMMSESSEQQFKAIKALYNE